MLKKGIILSSLAISYLFGAIEGQVKLRNLYFDYSKQKYVLPNELTANLNNNQNANTQTGDTLLSNYNNYLLNQDQEQFEKQLNNPQTESNQLVKDLNFNEIGKTFINNLVNNHSDMVEFVIRQPLLNKSSHVTIYSRVLSPRASSNADFINLLPSGEKYFIGVSSKNLGIGGGFEIGEKYSLTDNYKETIFYLKKINWLGSFSNYIYRFCKVKGYAPVWIFNPINFLNWTAKSHTVKSIQPAYPTDYIYDSGIAILTSSNEQLGSVCSMTPEEIANTLNKINTWNMPSSKGYFSSSNEVDSNKKNIFLKNGFIINFPLASYKNVDAIMGSFFATYMFINDIKHGIMISDTKPDIKTEHWTTGKYPWQKKIHVRRTIKIGTENYDIIFNSLLSPFNEYSLTNDWRNVDYTYVNVLNQLPAINRPLKSFTPDGHLMTFAFRKGGEISSSLIPGYSYQNEVSKKAGFNWLGFLVTVAFIGATFYVGSLFFTSGLAAGGLSFGTYLNFITSYGTLGLIGQVPATMFVVAGTMSTVNTIGNWFVKKPGDYQKHTIDYLKTVYANLLNEARDSTSTIIKNYTYIPLIIQKAKPASLVSSMDYRLAISAASAKGYNLVDHDTVTVDPKNFISEYRNTAAYLFYANHHALGQTIIPSSQYYKLQNDLVNGILMNSTSGYMNPSQTILNIINKEWVNN